MFKIPLNFVLNILSNVSYLLIFLLLLRLSRLCFHRIAVVPSYDLYALKKRILYRSCNYTLSFIEF